MTDSDLIMWSVSLFVLSLVFAWLEIVAARRNRAAKLRQERFLERLKEERDHDH